MMILSQASRDLIVRIADSGGSIEKVGNLRPGNALQKRGLVRFKKDLIVITAAGRKFIDKL